MAARTGCGMGCGALGFLVLVGMCAGGGSGGSPGSTDPSSASTSSSPSSYTPAGTGSAFTAERESGDWLYIHGPLNVRAEPNASARVVVTLRRGDMVRLGRKDANGWARIYSGSPDGYVYRASDRVRSTPPAAPRTADASRDGSRRSSAGSGGGSRRSSAASRGYHTGPRGGCYTYTSSGRKRYVDRSHCR